MPLEQAARDVPALSLAWPPNSVSTTNSGNIVLPKDPTDLLQGLVEQVRDNHLFSAQGSQLSAISHRTEDGRRLTNRMVTDTTTRLSPMAGRIPDPRIRPIDAERSLYRFGRLDRRASGADPADRADDSHVSHEEGVPFL